MELNTQAVLHRRDGQSLGFAPGGELNLTNGFDMLGEVVTHGCDLDATFLGVRREPPLDHPRRVVVERRYAVERLAFAGGSGTHSDGKPPTPAQQLDLYPFHFSPRNTPGFRDGLGADTVEH